MNNDRIASCPTRSRAWLAALAALALSPAVLAQQYTTPHVSTDAGAVTATLDGTTFVNHGLVGVGRISASAFDSFGETFGSVSGLQITNWRRGANGSYTGTFNILPDRGYNNNNSGGFFSDYAARIQTVDFAFAPYAGTADIGGVDIVSKIAAQSQITIISPISGVKFTYADPNSGAGTLTTGLDPGSAGNATIFGKVVPYVIDYTGQPTPGAANSTFENVNKLAIDAEGLALKADGSGYFSDEYGANVYYFNSRREIVGVIVPSAAVRPRTAGEPNFKSTGPRPTGAATTRASKASRSAPTARASSPFSKAPPSRTAGPRSRTASTRAFPSTT